MMGPLKVGNGVSIHSYSDTNPATVIKASNKNVTVVEDHAVLLNGPDSGEPDALTFHAGGFSGHTSGKQRWDIKPNSKGIVRKFSLRKSGRWVEVGHKDAGLPPRLSFGRTKFYDFNF